VGESEKERSRAISQGFGTLVALAGGIAGVISLILWFPFPLGCEIGATTAGPDQCENLLGSARAVGADASYVAFVRGSAVLTVSLTFIFWLLRLGFGLRGAE
jgi:hypothetical protein